MDILERINFAVSWLINNNLATNQQDLGFKLGYKSKAAFSHILNGKVPIPKNFIDKLCAVDHRLNPLWISAEEGNMILTNLPNASDIQGSDEAPHDLDLIAKVDSTEFRRLGTDHVMVIMPHINQFAYAGYVSGWSDPVYIESLPRHVIILTDATPGVYRSFTVRGDSMDNGMRASFGAGDVVCGRLLNKEYWKSKLHLHKYKNYVLVMEDGIQIKQIIEHRVEEGIVVCHSLNEDKSTYPDFEVNLSEVKEIYYIKARTEPLI